MKNRRKIFLIIFLIFGVAAAVQFYAYQMSVGRELANKQFNLESQKAFARTQKEILSYYTSLDNISQFYAASSYVDENEFTIFTEKLISQKNILGICWDNSEKDEKYFVYSDKNSKSINLCTQGNILDPLKVISMDNEINIILSAGALSANKQAGRLSIIIRPNLKDILNSGNKIEHYLIINDTNYQNIVTVDLLNKALVAEEGYIAAEKYLFKKFNLVESNGIYLIYLVMQDKLKLVVKNRDTFLLISLLILFLTLMISYSIFKSIQEEDKIRKKVADQTKIIEESYQEVERQKSLSFHNAKLASLGEMAAGVAHEINNPLNIISASSEMLKTKEFSKEKMNRYLDKIQNSVHRVSRIVYGLKRFSRSHSGIHLQETSLVEIVNNCLEMTSIKSKRNSIKVINNIKDDQILLVDQIQIEQILINLINNAVDAQDNSEINKEPWIELSHKINNQSHEIVVKDNGIGISDDNIQKLFDPFFTDKEVGKGTGLGLSISKRIAMDHGGNLEYRKNDGYTCFVLILKV